MMESREPDVDLLKFVAFSSLVKVDFWTELAARKLDTYRLNDDAQPIRGIYGSGRDARAPCRLLLVGESFSTDADGQHETGPGARFEECRAMGYVKNVNTKEAFRELDKPATLAAVAREIWADAIESERAIAQPECLLRFLLLTFADLKKSAFLHWFAFPTLGSQALFRLMSRPARASSALSPADALLVVEGLAKLWARSVEKSKRAGCPPFFVVLREKAVSGGEEGDRPTRVLSLLEYDGERDEIGDAEGSDYGPLFGFFDPSSDAEGRPGWPLRNFLMLLSARWGIKRARVLCFRELVPRAPSPSQEDAPADGAQLQGGETLDGPSLGDLLRHSVVLDIDLSAAPSTEDGSYEAARAAWLPPRVGFTGWEPNAVRRPGPRMSDLSSVLDPSRLAENSVRLNIKLMRWRQLPDLDVELLVQTKCLLLGAGTLGCAVARCLMGWGVQHITFADNGRVAYSNPVRQSLFSFEDCSGYGKFKAEAAAAALRAIYPGAKSAGHVLTIPMPGHPQASAREKANAEQDAETLEKLVSSHDVVYVLTDSRESRWLPTLLAAKHDKICINAALGLDQFVVVRHGGAPDGGGPAQAWKPPAASATGSMVEAVESAAVSIGSDAASADVAHKSSPRLGCYFCTDVGVPGNSSLNRTLDQQCTVTRPGLAPMAAATAVEITVGLLHHPLRQRAPADDSAARAKGMGAAEAAAGGQELRGLGALPHQVRGFIASFTTVTPTTLAFDCCTACSAAVVSAHRAKGWEFVKNACSSPQMLEEISGLAELQRGLDDVDIDLDWGVDDEDPGDEG